ncbi:putative beta-lactamase [Euzebya pacifica]|uniref:Putative beta-lactamase n=1 Tax=Euzebya pacifica TaxID=1608957 RepID=A0A346XXR7_9ACTN|nr:MBL fold metallo-hydrolase [Euzebya pacifica]AXV07014.1 putative beta-lactamase [Euzebya pacifica]
METIADGIIRLGSRLHNFYLLIEGGKATAIDVGCSGDLGTLVEGLAAEGLTLDDVEGIVLTHAHADHAGAAREAADKGVTVHAHRDEVDRLLGKYEGKEAITPLDLPLWKPAVWTFLSTLARRGVLKQPRLIDVTEFDDGDTLDLPGKPVVIHTPGHTEGHTAFHVPDKKVLFSGDAMVTIGLIGPGPGPQLMPKQFHNDVDLATASLERLEGIEADMVLPGHGDAYKGTPESMVEKVRARLGAA